MSNYVLESKLKIFNDLGEFLVDESAPLPPPPSLSSVVPVA